MISPSFPFSAVSRNESARKALLVSLIHPGLDGVALSGPPGSGKSFLVSSFLGFVAKWIDPDKKVFQLPIGADDSAILGGIDLEQTLKHGKTVRTQGLLDQARTGILVVEDMALHTAAHRAILKQFLDQRKETRFYCTTTPEERRLSRHLADAIPLLIGMERRGDDSQALSLLRRRQSFDRFPEKFLQEFARSEGDLAKTVKRARQEIHRIRLSTEAIEELALASYPGVAGCRALIFAARASRAHAALRGSDAVGAPDLAFARAVVFEARRVELPSEPEPPSKPSESRREEPSPSPAGKESDSRPSNSQESPPPSEDQVLPPALPPDLSEIYPFFTSARSASGSGGGPRTTFDDRGAHIRSMKKGRETRYLAISETLRQAATRPRRDLTSTQLSVHRDDLRYKQFSRRAGTLFILAVDASGSMARNRMREAKGVVVALLENAYLNRDSVALVGIRGGKAEVLLPPTGSVARAKRTLEVLPTGGGTPIASALEEMIRITNRERLFQKRSIQALLLTDGRANVPLHPSPEIGGGDDHIKKELKNIADRYAQEGVSTLVVDTRDSFDRRSDARVLASLLRARYLRMPEVDPRTLAEIARQDHS